MSYNTVVYTEQGGAVLTVASGGSIDIESGGSITDDGTQASAISDLTITYTAGTPSHTLTGTLTIAQGGTPTVDELLEFCEELKTQTNGILAAMRGVGILAT